MSEQTAMTTYERLAKRFPPEAHKKRKQGSAELTYVTGEMVISRLNEVLGLAGWSFSVLREGSTEVEAWVLGEMVVTIDGTTITRQQYGNQDVMRGSRATSDLFKSAATDALKKCATTIGVGLYLYDEDERREVEQEMREAARQPQRKAADPTPINNNVRDAAVITGANPPSGRGYQCAECGESIAAEATINIQKNKHGQRVDVAVEEFKPVCEARLEKFHCATCYDRKFWGAA
jgi:hypothetical protein